jgi:hypothetical protein
MLGRIFVRSTSDRTAEVTPPVVLRESARKRLVFAPVVVKNSRDPAAAVRGELVYESKNATGQWVRDKPFDARTLPAGESVRLELDSAALLRLHQCVAALYGWMAEEGFEYGTKRLISVDTDADLVEILESIATIGDRGQVKKLLGLMSQQNSEELAAALQDAEPEVSSRLVFATGLAKLRSFLEESAEALDSSDEKLWQRIIERNTWVIGQLFARPLVLLKREAYLGGKSIHNTGGNNADFLLRNDVTGDTLIVEIKTPATALTGNALYRNNAYAPSKELASAVQQVLQDLYSLRQSFSALTGDGPPEFRLFKPKLLLIIGNLTREQDVNRVRSFELFRNSIPDVDVITFDELVAKARLLLAVFEGAD